MRKLNNSRSHDKRGRPYTVSMANRKRGQAVRDFISEYFANQTDFAVYIGHSKQSVSNMCSGRYPMSPKLLQKLLLMFGDKINAKAIRPDLFKK